MSWWKIEGVSKHVAGLNTDHVLPFIITQIRQRFCALPPRIPNHRSEGVLFRNLDAAVQFAIDQLDLVLGIQVCAVSRFGYDDIAGLDFFAVRIRVIEVGRAIQATYLNVVNVPHFVESVQGLLETQRRRSAISHYKLQLQLTAKSDAVDQPEVVR